jgi:hypothetical protein
MRENVTLYWIEDGYGKGEPKLVVATAKRVSAAFISFAERVKENRFELRASAQQLGRSYFETERNEAIFSTRLWD